MLAYLILLSAAALVQATANWECPAPGIGICISECQTDDDCPGHNRKCCSNGCGHVCMGPHHTGPDCRLVKCGKPPCKNPVWIPGVCCPLCPGKGEPDEDKCKDICCLAPPCHYRNTVILPGHCCPLCVQDEECLFGSAGICGGIAGFQCEDDAQCMFIPKDIADGAGQCCFKVQPGGKKGRCPRKFDLKNCKNECKDDYDCAGVAKCCFNGCGNVCVKPKSYCCFEGEKKQSGESFPHPDGCNTCFCNDGLIACTKIFCP